MQRCIVSLEALQRAALGQGQGKVVDWLKSRGLEGSPRLARQLSVDKGWDRAVETVLGSYLEAVCVDSIEDVAGTLESLTAGTVTFFDGITLQGSNPVVAGAASRATSLLALGAHNLQATYAGDDNHESVNTAAPTVHNVLPSADVSVSSARRTWFH